ncbi:hypothetical protein F4823DRAFT_125831 [Ustulina deusta]|nr:hypothetical protein F4823DRAFT_125831 [Ustulina deusta]
MWHTLHINVKCSDSSGLGPRGVACRGYNEISRFSDHKTSVPKVSIPTLYHLNALCAVLFWVCAGAVGVGVVPRRHLWLYWSPLSHWASTYIYSLFPYLFPQTRTGQPANYYFIINNNYYLTSEVIPPHATRRIEPWKRMDAPISIHIGVATPGQQLRKSMLFACNFSSCAAFSGGRYQVNVDHFHVTDTLLSHRFATVIRICHNSNQSLVLAGCSIQELLCYPHSCIGSIMEG